MPASMEVGAARERFLANGLLKWGGHTSTHGLSSFRQDASSQAASSRIWARRRPISAPAMGLAL